MSILQAFRSLDLISIPIPPNFLQNYNFFLIYTPSPPYFLPSPSHFSPSRRNLVLWSSLSSTKIKGHTRLRHAPLIIILFY